MSLSCRSRAMASSGSRWPEPAGYSTVADDQVVQREPERPAPVGVPAEHRGGGLGRLIVDPEAQAGDIELVRMVAMVGGQRPQPVRGQELVGVEQPGEQPLQAVGAGHAEQEPPVARLTAKQALFAELASVVEAPAVEELGEVLAERQ